MEHDNKRVDVEGNDRPKRVDGVTHGDATQRNGGRKRRRSLQLGVCQGCSEYSSRPSSKVIMDIEIFPKIIAAFGGCAYGIM